MTSDPPGQDVGALLALTATELEVLEVAHLSGLVEHRPEPDDGADTSAVWVEAIRSLTARGLLGPDGRLAVDSVAGQIAQTVLDVRLGAAAVVVVERLLEADDVGRGRLASGSGRDARSGTRRDLRLLHLLPLGAVVEDVHAEGLHGFDLILEPDQLIPAVTDLVVPPDALPGPTQDGQASVVDIDADQVEQLPVLLGRPTVLVELTLATADGRAEGHLVALGPGGCWAAPRSPGRLRFAAVPPDWVGRTVDAWVSRVGGRGG